MKNILLVLNGRLTAPHVIASAIDIAKSTSSILHTVFINYKSDLTGYNYLFPNDLSLTMNPVTGKTIAEEDAELTESQTRAFKDECETANVAFFIEPQKDLSLGDIIHHSAFSDMVIADAHESFREHHIADLLKNAQCPIYLVAKDAVKTQHVILAYDGSVSSMYAIKMYSYLFPEFQDLPTYLLFINAGNHAGLPNEKNIRMWLSGHFPKLEIQMPEGDIKEQLVAYTASVPHALVVMGSYGRNDLSRFFHRSNANVLIEEGKSSVFMTHK